MLAFSNDYYGIIFRATQSVELFCAYFENMLAPYFKGNKVRNRPHYYCFEDSSTGIYWRIPLSSRIDKYRRIMEKKEKAGKPCDILHIVKLDDSWKSAFLIKDIFSNNGRIHRTKIHNRRKSSYVDE